MLLPPGSSYDVTVRLTTRTSRQFSQAELGVISQLCLVTAAVVVAPVAANVAAAANAAGETTDEAGGKAVPPAGWKVRC